MKEAIPVKQKHITHGRATSCCFCPVALALQERYKNAFAGLTQMSLMENYDDDLEKWFNTSPEVLAWMEAFDAGAPVEPFILILDHKAKTAEMMEEA